MHGQNQIKCVVKIVKMVRVMQK